MQSRNSSHLSTKTNPGTFEERALERLRERGFRITMPRIQVIRVLAEAREALSAYAIHEKIIKQKGRIDVVSVYRILATLVEANLVHHIGVVDGYLACRMEDEHEQQMEHVICSSCGLVTEIEVDPQAIKLMSLQLDRANFSPASIKIEILGRCARCSS